MEKNQRLKSLGNNIKKSNILIMGAPERDEKKLM